MSMPTGMTAILPKKYTSATLAKASVDRLLLRIGVNAQRTLQRYPPAQPWKNPPPKTGLRAGGRRTGSLGKGWSTAPVIVSGESVTITNQVPYAVYVEGPSSGKPGQTSVMAARGWPSVTEVGAAAVAEAVKSVKMEA